MDKTRLLGIICSGAGAATKLAAMTCLYKNDFTDDDVAAAIKAAFSSSTYFGDRYDLRTLYDCIMEGGSPSLKSLVDQIYSRHSRQQAYDHFQHYPSENDWERACMGTANLSTEARGIITYLWNCLRKPGFRTETIPASRYMMIGIDREDLKRILPFAELICQTLGEDDAYARAQFVTDLIKKAIM